MSGGRCIDARSLAQGIEPTDEGVVALFERVRDIPFSFTSHPDADTLLTVGSGTW